MSIPVRDSIGAIKRTGEMMLSGWKLLATVCPVCTTALLSKGEQLRCPSCDLPVMVEGDERINNYHSVPAAKPAPVAQPASVKHYAGETDVPTSLEELKKEYDAKNKRKNAVSAKLGEKMLSGYTLLGSTCPKSECSGTPLMCLKNGPMICVSCEGEFEFSESDEIVQIVKPEDKLKNLKAEVASTAKQLAAPVSQPPAKTAEELELERIEKEYEGFDFDSIPTLGVHGFAVDPNDTSTKISEKLMRGWALLDEVCPDTGCQVPLMRNQDGEKVCVACGYVHGKGKVSQDERSAATLAASAASSVAKASSSATAAAAAANKNTSVTVSRKNETNHRGKASTGSESDEESRDLNALYDEDTDVSSEEQEDTLQAGGDDPVGEYIAQWKQRLLSKQGTTRKVNKTPATAAADAAVRKTGSKDGVKVKRCKTSSSNGGGVGGDLSGVTAVLYAKVHSTAEALERCESIEKSIRLTELIHKLVLTIQTMERSSSEGRGGSCGVEWDMCDDAF